MKNIQGKRKDGGDSSRDNPENHYKCPSCGDMVYMGSLEEVFYHEKLDTNQEKLKRNQMKTPELIPCPCGRKPWVIGDGIKPSYGTTIQCPNDCGKSEHIAVMNNAGTGKTLHRAIRRWNLQFSKSTISY